MPDMENSFEKIGKKMPYTVPDGYFEQMHEQLSAIPRRQRRVVTFRWLAIAAAFVLVASVGFFSLRQKPQVNTMADVAKSLSDEELASWIEFNDNDVFLALMEE